MIRVLQVVVSARTVNRRRGLNGPEVRALAALRCFDPAHVEIVVAYARHGLLWDEFVNQGARLAEFEVHGKFDWTSIWRLARITRSQHIQVIHSQGSPAVDLFCALVAGWTGRAYVVTRPVLIDDVPSYQRITRFTYRLADRLTMRQAQAIVAINQRGYECIKRFVPPHAHKVHLIQNGVDLDRFRPVDAGQAKVRLGLAASTPTIGMVAQLDARKDHESVLSATRQLVEKYPELRVYMVGDGPRRAEVQSLAEAMGLERQVVFVGFVADVAPVVGAMDVVVLASFAEGTPVSLLEAMSMGKPIVASAVGGVPELIGANETGRLVPARSASDLVHALDELLSDEPKRHSLGRAGRRRVEKAYSLEAMARHYQEVYLRVASDHKD
jgi:glycosyltransferase involved in cell wall biosynthesis